MKRERATAIYPIAIHRDPGTDFGVTVPDVPGCFSAGSSVEEAFAMAQEAIEFHLDLLAEDGDEIPLPTSIDAWREHPDFKGDSEVAPAIWGLVPVRLPGVRSKTQVVAA